VAERPGDEPEVVVGPIPWPNLPKGNGARFRTLLGRAFRRRCPYCGGGNIFASYFSLKPICPTCEVQFEREEGYFLGGYALNLVVSEFFALGLAVWLIFGTRLREAPLLAQEALAVALAVAFPVTLFPFSRTVWMAIDLFLNPPHENQERYLRAGDLQRPRRRPN
jgi:uncharacterized protein (DUF983 family)